MTIKNSVKNVSKILKVETFREGPFTFSTLYDELKILPLLREAEVRYDFIKRVPIIPENSARLEEELIRKSIFGTAAIEGNPLSEDETDRLISQKNFPAEEESKKRAQQEILNLKDLYSKNLSVMYGILKDLPVYDPTTDEEHIKTIHRLITKEISHKDNIPGQYRNSPVKVGNKDHGGVYSPPKIIDDIKTLMREFIVWINSEELLQESPLIRAALAHYFFAKIHPFADGNGRSARFIEAVLLKKTGFRFVPAALSNYYYQHLDDYYWAFSKTHKDPDHAVTEFLVFFLTAFNSCLEQIQDKIASFTKKTFLSNYYSHLKKKNEISRNSQKILDALLDNPTPFDLERFCLLYGKASEATGRRHIKKLLELKLIKEKKDTKGRTKVYELNLDVLN